ncbi:adenylyl-sulfate kinase [Salinicoccus albus]|uniref:adenylyl-sulfate kinase n=1 Tax=Salinicoccus albus TaxID=418756 RepID=UPI0003758821|nr:adenylyl-sulfate kinase [Salinicoccus albus]
MKPLLKFITCGSVDDGKSTLIGHMLYDAKLLFTDQIKALELESKLGSRAGNIDYSLLLDGLMAEREQGITIDVAYRYFTSSHRSFIVADTPGHEEYTRNMAVGASAADLAVILVDVTQGLTSQTKRHLRICALMGIRHFVLAVNKMDLTGYDRKHFEEIKTNFEHMAASFNIASLQVIPISATEGDNITENSSHTPWYTGLPLLPYLELIEVGQTPAQDQFVMPVQRVSRPNHEFRGFQGQVETGTVSIGEELQILPGNESATVESLLFADEQAEEASAGQPITVQLNKEVDVSRGSVLTTDKNLQVNDMLSASVLWMDDRPLHSGRNYLIKIGTRTVPGSVMKIKHKTDTNTGEKLPADRIYKNELAECEISLAERIPFDKFSANASMGSMIFIDRVTNMTSGCGVVERSLQRSKNIEWQKTEITPDIRARQKGQVPLTIWFTGLSGSGKTTLANEIEKRLASAGYHTTLLDGDNVRHGLNKDLGFNEGDRVENIRRIAEVARLMNDGGLITLASFISPYESDRENAREIIGNGQFITVYVNTPIEVCEQRDTKGLYRKARAGEITSFTGVTGPYEAPSHPDITVDTAQYSVEDAAELILSEVIRPKISR